MKKVTNELCFRIIKILDIAYISVIGLFCGFLLAIISDKLFGKFNKEKFDEEKENNKYFVFYLASLMILVLSYTGILNYILRNVLQLVPSPFHGICNFDHYRVGEIKSIPSIIFILFFLYQYDLFSYSREYFSSHYFLI